jgi:F-type H+-transporting ATPase subunit delta
LRPHLIARRYAKALFELADRENSIDRIIHEVNAFGQVLATDVRLREFLFSPQVDRRLKTLALEAALAGKVSQLFYHFLLLLLRKGRQQLYEEIVFEMGRLDDVRNHRLRATVVSCTPLTEVQLKTIHKRLAETSKAEILIDNQVDASILGGLVIQVGGKVLNAGLAYQLDQLRKELQQSKFESTLH